MSRGKLPHLGVDRPGSTRADRALALSSDRVSVRFSEPDLGVDGKLIGGCRGAKHDEAPASSAEPNRGEVRADRGEQAADRGELGWRPAPWRGSAVALKPWAQHRSRPIHMEQGATVTPAPDVAPEGER